MISTGCNTCDDRLAPGRHSFAAHRLLNALATHNFPADTMAGALQRDAALWRAVIAQGTALKKHN